MLGVLLFCSATLWFRLIGCMYFYIKILSAVLKQMLSNWKRLWGHSVELVGLKCIEQLCWSAVLMHACCGNPHYLFSSAHVLHIKMTAKYFSLQIGFLKMQAGCEIRNKLSDPRTHCIIVWKVMCRCTGPSNDFYDQQLPSAGIAAAILNITYDVY